MLNRNYIPKLVIRNILRYNRSCIKDDMLYQLSFGILKKIFIDLLLYLKKKKNNNMANIFSIRSNTVNNNLHGLYKIILSVKRFTNIIVFNEGANVL